MISKGEAKFRGCQSHFLIIGRVGPLRISPIMEIAVVKHACSNGGLHTPTAVQGNAVAVRHTCCHGIAFVTSVFGLKLIGSAESVDAKKMASLWAGRKPIAHLGLQGYELGAKFVKLEWIAVGI